MTLNEFVASKKRAAFDDVLSGIAPHGFSCDVQRLKELSERGKPTMGTTVLKPGLIVFEFVFTFLDGQTDVLQIEMEPPERIVYLPVPPWVVESIWQGEVQGSHHFSSHAKALIEQFALEADPENNKKWFEKQVAKRRE